MAATAQLDVRAQFPTLQREGLAYLDSAATSQTPDAVLAAMDDYYRHHRASVHRGTYPLAAEATDLFEGARTRIAQWLGWTPRDTLVADGRAHFEYAQREPVDGVELLVR